MRTTCPISREGAEAVATLKGRPQVRFPLKFVYVEPYVIPKQSLTGNNSERVDTRVLQVIYELPEDRPVDVYIGQQMDVYLKAVPAAREGELEFGGGNSQLPFEEKPRDRGRRGRPPESPTSPPRRHPVTTPIASEARRRSSFRRRVFGFLRRRLRPGVVRRDDLELHDLTGRRGRPCPARRAG